MKIKNSSILLVLITVIFCFALAGCDLEEYTSDIDSTTNMTTKITATLQPITTTEKTYADDEVVNDFIMRYNNNSKSPFKEIKRGNIRTKYHAVSYGYWFEMLNANDTGKIDVTISASNKNSSKLKNMKKPFHDTVKSINSSLADDAIDSFFDKAVGNINGVENTTFKNMKISFYPKSNISDAHIEVIEK